MPHYCCVIDCQNIGDKGGFFLFPPARTRSPLLQELARIRRNRWFAAINDKTLNTKTARVCSRHFISGKSAGLKDHQNPDWVPSLHLGYNAYLNALPTKFEGQTKMVQKNEELVASQGYGAEAKENVPNNFLIPGTNSVHCDAMVISDEGIIDVDITPVQDPFYDEYEEGDSSQENFLQEANLVSDEAKIDVNINPAHRDAYYNEYDEAEHLRGNFYGEASYHNSAVGCLTEIESLEASGNSVGTSMKIVGVDILESCHRSVETQTDLCMTDYEILSMKLQEAQHNLKIKDMKIAALETELRDKKMGMESFRDNDTRTKYFTGLPYFLTLNTIYNAIEPNIPHCLLKNLNKFQILMLTLIKLRLDLPFSLLGYMFGISTQTVSRKFHDCILVLSKEMNAFVRWPDITARNHFTPFSFKYLFGDRLAVIIDCFEIRIEKSGDPLARAATYSSYKSSETVKYLIGIAPSGNISYISKGFGGRTSDKFIAENSDFLEHIQPGDIVLSDRGFLIEEAIKNKGAELKTPAFLQGKSQLDANSPMTTVTKKLNEDEVYYDAIVRTCCGLVNLTPSVIPSTLNN